MVTQFLFLLPAAAALGLFLLLHGVLWQVIPQPRKGTLALSLTAGLAYGVVGAAAHSACAFPLPLLFWVSGPVYAFLVMLYFHFYFGVDRSVSMRILGELARAPEGRMTLDELDAAYSQREMVTRRLGVMVEKGYIAESHGHYTIADKGRVMVRLALFGKRVYNLHASG